MVVSIAQPGYWPWLGYFDRILKSDLHIVLDHVQFEKSWFINRNRIRCGDSWQWLTIPVKTKGRFGNLPINQIEVDERQNWKIKHWRTLRHQYYHTCFWKDFEPELNAFYHTQWPNFRTICLASSQIIAKALSLKTPLLFSSQFTPSETKGALVLELCQKAGATTYLSGPLGKNYLSINHFEAAGIQVEWHHFSPPAPANYPNPTTPPRSALDFLLHLGPNGLLTYLRS